MNKWHEINMYVNVSNLTLGRGWSLYMYTHEHSRILILVHQIVGHFEILDLPGLQDWQTIHRRYPEPELSRESREREWRVPWSITWLLFSVLLRTELSGLGRQHFIASKIVPNRENYITKHRHVMPEDKTCFCYQVISTGFTNVKWCRISTL